MSTEEKAESLAAKGTWEEFDEQPKNESGNSSGAQSDRPKAVYMSIDTKVPGKYVYKLRPVGAHVKYRSFFRPYKAKLSEEDKATDPAWKNGWYPSKRYAINVIDRADGKLKILDKGASVFKGFANYKSLFGKNPADPKVGADFALTVVVPKGKDGKANALKTEYTVTHIQETPLTPEEVAMIKAQGLWPLTKIYKPTPLEKRIDMWNSLPESAKVAPKRDFGNASESTVATSEAKAETKPTTPVEEKMVDAPADSNDLFEDDNQASEEKTESAELF